MSAVDVGMQSSESIRSFRGFPIRNLADDPFRVEIVDLIELIKGKVPSNGSEPAGAARK
jgi:hypothetical protein